MAVESLFVTTTPRRRTGHPRPRWQRRLVARYRLWRQAQRRALVANCLDPRLREDVGLGAGQHYRWLDELMRGYRP